MQTVKPSPLPAVPGAGGRPHSTWRRPPGWAQRWSQAAAAFDADLEARGYSTYTRRDYRTDVLRLGVRLGIPPEQLGSRHLKDADAVLQQEGLSLAARRRRLSALGRFLEFQAARHRPKPLGPRVLQAVADQSPLDRLLVALVYLAGLRLPEVAGLEGRDIQLKKEVLTTRLGYRRLPLHPCLKTELVALRTVLPLAAYRPVVSGANGFAVNARTLHGRFQRLMGRVDMPQVKPEALRREVAVYLMTRGVPPGLVTAFLGRDRGRPVAPRKGRLVDLTCLRDRLANLPVNPDQDGN